MEMTMPAIGSTVQSCGPRWTASGASSAARFEITSFALSCAIALTASFCGWRDATRVHQMYNAPLRRMMPMSSANVPSVITTWGAVSVPQYFSNRITDVLITSMDAMPMTTAQIITPTGSKRPRPTGYSSGCRREARWLAHISTPWPSRSIAESTKVASTAREPEHRKAYSLPRKSTKLIQTEDLMVNMTSESWPRAPPQADGRHRPSSLSSVLTTSLPK
mmetsp:Transcript_64836/g.193207  ORF Transcript_64836/g.193207 Transcript_64836/m.193207 type:complete len:220 (-) Transcript_64836:187-846(-)